jgi:hypothetical protein
MALIHDDDLTLFGLYGLGGDTVGGFLYFALIVLIFSCLQSLEALQPEIMLRHLRRVKPKVYDATFGPSELLPIPNFCISLSGDVHTKDPSSCENSANTENLRVATLSTTFGVLCEFYILRSLLLDCIASVSVVADIGCMSSKCQPPQWTTIHQPSGTAVSKRVSEPLRCCYFNINLTRRFLGR